MATETIVGNYATEFFSELKKEINTSINEKLIKLRTEIKNNEKEIKNIGEEIGSNHNKNYYDGYSAWDAYNNSVIESRKETLANIKSNMELEQFESELWVGSKNEFLKLCALDNKNFMKGVYELIYKLLKSYPCPTVSYFQKNFFAQILVNALDSKLTGSELDDWKAYRLKIFTELDICESKN